ncbi:hypothetical protein AJ80_06351 [Polytolypa hystricis UAMH7299]|uniref:Copper acquisition factor BIM1-like domain-containing protein n=1 Tax=Polytolypa hystricis (strain UAMH7299) TaxID=1447883 RepID=A0A2B7XY07_POLH7|nr:hypothetical protein AJ80_06351 [Polytolypa hystricis UAMH7299]
MMHPLTSLTSLLSLSTLALAHFKLDSPKVRGYNDNDLVNFPCGGQKPSSDSDRTPISLDDPQLSIALTMGHDQSAIQVLLGLGENPGENFNITLVPTFRQTGLGAFCLPSVELSEEVLGRPLEDGLKATLQVVTNGDPTGGLYNCADLTFSRTASLSTDSSECKNNTGVSAQHFSGDAARRNANESTPNGQAQSGGNGGSHGDHDDHDDDDDSSSEPTQTDSSSASESSNVAMPLETAAWGVLGAVVAGGIAML